MPKPKPYYTLAICESGRWTPQFGDYDRAVVAQEARDSYRLTSDGKPIRACQRIILKSEPDNDSIDAAVAKLNGSAR
jgi:hypothetical protein